MPLTDSPAPSLLDGVTAGESVADFLWRSAALTPDRPAVIERERVTSYESLRGRAAAFAVALRDIGVSPGDRVAVFLERTTDAVAAVFGVHAAGGIATVINSRLRARQVEYVLEHSGATALLSTREMLAAQPRALVTDARFIDVATVAERAVFDVVPRGASAQAQIIYTSGSTGLPKGVVFTNAALDAGTRTVMTYLGLRPDDRIAALLPFSSVYGLNQVMCSVRVGATLLIVDSPVANDVITALANEEVTVLAAVPPLWAQLLDAPAFTNAPLPSLRQMQNAGGHLPTSLVRRLRDVQPQADLVLQYGQTETFRGSYLHPRDVDARPDSMGKPIPGTEVLVLREDATPCEPGEIGELVQFGPAIAAGYWGDSAATARVFREHPRDPGRCGVYSGDLVRRDADGFFYFVSRRDRLIKTLGYRVGPDEIVDVLFASGEIVEAVVATEPDRVRGERIVAYVVLTPAGTMARLMAYARRELPRYMQPARFEIRERLLRLVSGKYDMDAIRGDLAPQPAS